MSVEQFDLGEVLAKLQTDAAKVFRLVEGIAGLTALGQAAPMALPASYLFVKEEASEDNAHFGRLSQRTIVDFGVLIIARDLSDVHGGAAADALAPLKLAVLDSLLGWQPPSAETEITHVGGNVVSFSNGLVGWEMTLSTAFYLRKD